jgi:RNA polymerase sigma-70 factor (ECF subfamily)
VSAVVEADGLPSSRGGQDRDEAFVGALWIEHGDALLGHVRRRVGDRGRAEDIVQEVLLRAWRHADHLEGEGRSLRPWLFTVADHVATDQDRRRRARPREVAVPSLAEGAAPDLSDRTIVALDVAAALRSLSSEHRSVLVETYYRGRSVAEAAKVLGIPDGTVKSRAYYALRALRLHLEERGWSR